MKIKNRNCYCSLWEKSPATLQKQGVKPGFCGICSICGAQGHLQHAPGCHPYSDAWCDGCYRVQALVNNLQCIAMVGLILCIVFQKWLFAIGLVFIFVSVIVINAKGKKLIRYFAGT
ncbi:hypothetical protein [Arenicella chitinivorans]|uniref:hypothetical protein n=1 Tax=Arenicella chitinivorans TaxID=1329800 RepID=UPI001679F34D|nr:hypothetical protein [Arenicella chitinivorans]